MIDIFSETVPLYSSFTPQEKEIAQEAYDKKNIIGLKMFQRELLSTWEEHDTKIKQTLFDEYKKRTGRHVTQDIKGTKSILAKIAKRKKIVNDMEYQIVNDYLSDNIEDYSKDNIEQWNALLNEYTSHSPKTNFT